ncbi:MAG: enoyl-CoA hydratase/isomerase family protein [bacterium]|nr:enoyl-CoA hydratase/isomerase family protein [bacterium]
MPRTTHSTIALERHADGRILVLALNRPALHNAINLRMIDEIGGVLSQAAQDPGLACLVITGTGEKTFTSGGDLKEFASIRTREAAEEMSLRMQRLARAIRRAPFPVLAAMNGDAYGGGLEFSLAADARVVDERAKLGFLQVTIGVTPAWRGISRARELLPRSTALLLMLTGDVVDAQQALAFGLVDRVAPAGCALEVTLTIARRIASHPPLAVRAIKRMLDAPSGDEDEALQREASSFAGSWISEDHWEALAARSERRAGEYRGR